MSDVFDAWDMLLQREKEKSVIERIIEEVKKMDTLITRSEVLEVIDKCMKGE